MFALWIPELNLPIAELLPSIMCSLKQSGATSTRAPLDAGPMMSWRSCRTKRRRFGPLPPAASNLFAIAKLR